MIGAIGARSLSRSAGRLAQGDFSPAAVPVFAVAAALCEVSLDGSDLAERLDRDRENPDNQRAVDAAAALVREHNSWRRRGQQIYQFLENGGPMDLNLMPQARNRADIAAALTA
jgi:hypothetical protein